MSAGVNAGIAQRRDRDWSSAAREAALKRLGEIHIEGVEPEHPATSAAFIPYALHPKQREFFDWDGYEALYGGAAGGGKSIAMLATALKYAHLPGYSAIILRRNFGDLFAPKAIGDIAKTWLRGHATFNAQEKTFRFPWGATLQFAYLDKERALDGYQGAAYHFVGFDELTQHLEGHYLYLHSRCRRSTEGSQSKAPLRVRATANPGGRGHEWVKLRFIDAPDERRFFPASLRDNPSIDYDEYVRSLSNLHPLEQQRLLDGNWDAQPSGGFFERGWFDGKIIDWDAVPGRIQWVRFWDFAATETAPGKDPDWTAGALVGQVDGIWYIADVRRARLAPPGVEELVAQTAEEDGRAVKVRIEQEPGSAGVHVIDHYRRKVLVGYDFDGVRSTGEKVTRAAPVASAAKAGNVRLVRGEWVRWWLEEATAFPHGSHDDGVDAVSGGVSVLGPRDRSSNPGTGIHTSGRTLTSRTARKYY